MGLIDSRARDVDVTATATVRVLLEIDAGGCWSKDATVAQVDTQAIDAAEGTLRQLEAFARSLGVGVRVVGAPLLVSTTLRHEKRK
jgi:hypothetical protein